MDFPKPSIPRDEDGNVDLLRYAQQEVERSGMSTGSVMAWGKLSYVVEEEELDRVPTWGYNLWRALTFFLPRRRVPIALLEDVSGYVKPGMNVLLLGPPGAGKTTLLETLSGRKRQSKHARLTGGISVNGKPWTSDFNRIAGYVTQEDVHIPTMTVRETVTFSSVLRNHPDLDMRRKLQRVQVALEVLGIDHRADTIVGGELIRGVSGGEKKRVSIAVELTTSPVILFLDEPTTGLDSASAYDVCKALRTLADVGIPVICSLLQPSQELFELFDTVILLADRHCIYFGPSENVLEHFEGAGYHCPPRKNVAEFLLDICTPKGREYADEGAVEHTKLVEYYKDSPAFSHVATAVMKGVRPEGNPDPLPPLGRTYASSDFTQAVECTKRAAKTFVRNMRVIVVRMIRAVLIGLVLGTLFFQMNFSVLGANNRISLLFYCITFTAMGSIASIPAAIEERRVFYHQRALHFYRTFGYFFANLVVDIPMSVLEVLVFSLIVYWMTGMYQHLSHYVAHFLTFFVILMFTSLAAKQFCRLCAAATPSLVFASSLAPAVLCVWLVFTGFLIPRNSIPYFWYWMHVIDPFRYTFEALAINGLDGIPVKCKSDEYVPPKQVRDEPPYDGATVCPLESGDELLENFGLYTSAGALWADVGILAGFYAVFCILNYTALALLKFQSTGSSAAAKTEDVVEVEEPSADEVRIVRHALKADETTRLVRSAPSDSEAGASLSFSNINYTVFIKEGIFKEQKELQLLHNINGYVEPGQMVALMGASGAGKSTLLDVLAGRKTGGRIEGCIRVNGYPKDEYYPRLIGYVEQFNVFLPTVTVREVLLYNARMRLDESYPDEYKVSRVEQVIDQLGLRAVENRMVGDADGGGLSPELRKKLSIGAELVANPKILFLDEPTSGLDSQAAEAVMRTTRDVCNSGVPVICTIHQPSAELFLLFDWLLLMRPGGRTIYFGPMGEKASVVLDYFAKHDLHCERRKNPADFVLEASGAGIASANDKDFASEWDKSVEKKEVEHYIFERQADAVPPVDAGASSSMHVQTIPSRQRLTFASPFAVSMGGQLKESIKRAFMNKYRTPAGNRMYLAVFIGMALLLGTLYWLQPLDQTGARNRVALIYFLIVFAGLGAIASIPGVVLSRAVYYREKPAFLRPFAYFVAQVLAEIPLILVGSSAMGIIVYFMTGMNLDHYGEHFYLFYLIYIVSSLTCVMFAMMMATIAKTTEVANSLVGISASIFSLFAGFIIPRASIPWWWIWLHYISYFKYPLEAMCINEMYDDTFNCDDGRYVDVPVVQPNGTTINEPYCPINGGLDFISYQFTMDTKMENLWIDLGVLCGFLIFFTFMIYVGLVRVNHLTR